MKKLFCMFLITLLVAVPLLSPLHPKTIYAETEDNSIIIDTGNDCIIQDNYYTNPSNAPEWLEEVNEGFANFYIFPYGKEITFTVSNSNPSVIRFKKDFSSVVIPAREEWIYEFYTIDYDILSPGTATITISCDNVTKNIDVIVPPENTNFKEISQAGANELTFYWKPVAGTSGYEILQLPEDADPYSDTPENAPVIVANPIGDTATCASIYVPHEVAYQYAIRTYTEKDGIRYYGRESDYPEYRTVTATKLSPMLEPVQISGEHFSLTWSKIPGVLKYHVYRSTMENGNYTCIATLESQINQYSETRKKGTTYYYYVTAQYSDGESLPSSSTSGFLPANGKKKQKKYSNLVISDHLYSMYSGNYATTDTVNHYIANGTLYTTVAQYPDKLLIYSFNKNLKYEKKKSISLGTFDSYGGFYHGLDGNFYVVLGYNNYKESKTKTVIKVIQFDKNWKKKKVCNIKGNATNVFDGIVTPFRAGSCRMDMKDSNLYIHTARTMFVHADGLNHQSNITFCIDTKNMKYTCTEDTYSSHSFNQFIKLKDNSIYFTNHGDAYPRSITVETIDDYGSDNQTTRETHVLEILGEIGANATGTTVGGMEIGSNSILVCGTSQPHKDTIKGITGFDSYRHNVYLAIVNRNTGKYKRIWLTNYHPKNTTYIVGDTRMVKLSDSRFAILFNITKNNKTTLQYIVVDNNGTVIHKTQYKDYSMNGSVQPILYNGSICWASTAYQSKTYKNILTLQKIPAIY